MQFRCWSRVGVTGVASNVQEGEHVRAGEPLIDGPLNPHDLLAVLGEKYTQAYLVNASWKLAAEMKESVDSPLVRIEFSKGAGPR
jgi:hypothetical protein